MKKLILVANVAKEHVLKFHVPIIKSLSDEGWQVDVACGGEEDIPFCNKHYVLPMDRSPFKTHFVKSIRCLMGIIDSEKYDVVYCHTTVGSIVARLAAKRFRKRGLRVVMFAHGTYFYKGAPLRNYLCYPLYKYLGRITDDIITITREDFDFTRRHYRSVKPHYLHGVGMDVSRFQMKVPDTIRCQYRASMHISDDAIVLIYVAEVNANKNQLLLLSVLKQICFSHSNTFLLLVGPIHDGGKTRRFADELDVSDHVRFLGWRNDVHYLLAASDICTASSKREGLGLNLIEAMAMGLPVVAVKNSGHAEILQNDPGAGYLVPFDVGLFAAKVIELIDDKTLRERMGTEGKHACKKYDSDIIVPQIIDILNN